MKDKPSQADYEGLIEKADSLEHALFHIATCPHSKLCKLCKLLASRALGWKEKNE